MKWAVGLWSLAWSTLVFSQPLSTEYFDRYGEKCQPGSSYYFSVGKKNRNGFFYDTVRSYYTPSRRIKDIEIRDQFGNPMGRRESFYENGILRSACRYDRKATKERNSDRDSIDFRILEFSDSLGQRQVVGGEGTVHGIIDFLEERGKVKDGLRDSVWTVLCDNGKVYSLESWHLGALVDGISFDRAGKEYYYKEQRVLPAPAGGMQEFYRQTSKKMKYPKDAERRGIEGKVKVAFTVEEDGSITSPVVVQGLGFGCDEEALKAVAQSRWEPCRQKGQPVKYQMMIPIAFKLK